MRADPEPLLQALEGFAKHGTFVFIDEDEIAEMLMRHQLRALRADGMKYEAAIAELAENHHTSESVIARMVRTKKISTVNVNT